MSFVPLLLSAFVVASAPSGAPVIATISAGNGGALGDIAGGKQVDITGTGFTDASSVTFDGTPGTSLVVSNDNLLSVIAPAHAAGVVDVVVTTPAGNSGASGASGYEYWAPSTASLACYYREPNYDGGTATWTASVGTDATQTSSPAPAESSGAPDCERSTDFPLGNSVQLSTFLGTGNHTMFAVMLLESITTTAATSVWTNEGPIADTGLIANLYMRKSGSQYFAGTYCWDGSEKKAEVEITSLVNGSGAGPLILQGRKSDGNLQVRAIGPSGTGSWVTGDACGTTVGSTGALMLGAGGGSTIDGIMYAVGSKTAAWTDDEATKFERWAQNDIEP